MNSRHFSLSKAVTYSATLLLLANCPFSWSAEGVSPLQPGATTGNHVGALPPAGFYMAVDTAYENGKIQNGKGDTAVTPAGQTIEATNISSVIALTWVTDYEIAGARYAAAIAQPYKWSSVDFSSSSSSNEVNTDGLINTAITPAILSWDLGEGYFVSTAFTVYLDNGDFSSTYDSDAGRNVKNTKAVGNHYWTFEPSVAFTRFGQDWNITLNNILDFNTENNETHYQSGMTYYLDATATRRADKWTYGLIGNLTKQITDDEVNGESVAASVMNSEGNRAEHILAGAVLGYDFGSFSLNSRFLYSVRAKNDADVSFFHIGLSFPIQ